MTAMTLESKRSPWWLLLMSGIFSVIIGVLLLTSPAKTAVTLVFALGLYWLVTGIFALVGMFVDHSGWGWKLLIGVISIIAGIAILNYPIMATLTIIPLIILMMGIQGVIVGVVNLALAFKGGGWGAGILGVLSIIFGLVLMLNFAQLGTAIAFVWVVAIFALVGGIVQIIQSFRQRSAEA